MSERLADTTRIVYKRRWVAAGAFCLVFAYGATNSLRKTPTYQATTRLFIEKAQSQAQVLDGPGDASWSGQFDQTQIRILRSRALAWRALENLGMHTAPGSAERQELVDAARRAQGGWLIKVAGLLGAPRAIPPPAGDETSWQSLRIDRFLAGVALEPVGNSRLIDIRYHSADPAFAARAADATAQAYIELVREFQNSLADRARLGGTDLRAHESAEGALVAAHARVVDGAEMPRLPVLPNYERDLMFALMLAGLLAVGLTVSMEYLDSRLKTPDDIKSYLGLPFLGLVPAVQSRDVKGSSPLLERGVPPAFSEAMRAVRTAVMFSAEGEGARSLVVTSTAPGEGKTVVAANLADALARAEQRTLLVDGDMRKPRVHEVYEFAQEPGLANVLAGTTDAHAAIRQTGTPHLSILPAGTIPSNPAELLGSPRYRQLLADLGKTFDWIILDSPPVMAVTDAAVISNTATSVLFVVGADMTPRRIAQAAIEQIAAARGRVAGAVLNRVNLDKHSYYYAQYYRKDYAGPYIGTAQGRERTGR